MKDSDAYSRIPSLFEKPKRFKKYCDDDELIEHIVHCHDLFSFGLNCGEGGFSKWLHYASLFVILLSQNNCNVIENIINPLMPRYQKREEVWLIHMMLKGQYKENKMAKKLLDYMDKVYPDEWLNCYVNEDNETSEGNKIYSLKKGQMIFIPYVKMKKIIKDSNLIYQYELCQTDFNFSNVRAIVLHEIYTRSYINKKEVQRFEITKNIGEFAIPIEKINDKTWLRFEDHYQVYWWELLKIDNS